jgi:hypothetical protein
MSIAPLRAGAQGDPCIWHLSRLGSAYSGRVTEVPAGKVRVENVNHPGYRTVVDAVKYAAARDALLAALPQAAPGLTQAEMIDATVAGLPTSFPGGEKAGWWTKCAQLDLEAKGLIVRDGGKPLRWRLA